MREVTLSILMYGVPAIIICWITIYILRLRRIVPTNVVHIVQRGKNTVSYGVGKESNVYYEFPKWMPIIGVEVRELPVSNFDIQLENYSAYDKDRVPFVVDITAFFHISDTNKAAEKVESFAELKAQLTNIVQGTVRSILAKSKLENIMEERPTFGKQFTENVSEDLKNWGAEAIKNIELMDVRDAKDSKVIHQIMAKRMSAIDMESRTEVAENHKKAEQAELEARKEVDVTAAKTEQIAGEEQAKSKQAIGIAQAESKKQSGIADENALAEIATAAKATAEQQMEVVKVNEIRQADITKEAFIIKADQKKREIEIQADAEKYKVEMDAVALLQAKKKEAEAIKSVGEAEADVIKAKGTSEAEAKKQMELANVTAQTTLAKEIGENEGYQGYLVRIREVEITGEVNKVQYQSLATALNGADLKLLVNSGDVNSGLSKFSDILSSKGASSVNGLVEGLKQTEEGNSILDFINKVNQVVNKKK